MGDPWRVFRLTLQYDGTAYSGFQRHRLESPPSIQSTVEAALARLVNHPVAIQAAGRTDAGVHATGQVVSLATRAQRSVQTLVRGANALLPDDIRVLDAAEAPRGFHPRFWARSRTYEYLLATSPSPDAFWRRRVWQVRGPLDLERMRHAGRLLLGTHDFSTFCAQVPGGDCRMRNLLSCQVEPWKAELPGPWRSLDGLVLVRIRANAFLRRMVRMLTAALVRVGQGAWEPREPLRRLDLRDSGAAPPPAPPWGLYLVDVEYL